MAKDATFWELTSAVSPYVVCGFTPKRCAACSVLLCALLRFPVRLPPFFAIEYLRPAINIPYCHHEKWDGTGYPRGLKGQQIPLEARIFAIVDVYDALTSDRPYRAAWPREKALAYIEEQSGKYFDPKIAAAFLAIIKGQR